MSDIQFWSPVTHDLGLIRCPVEQIASAFLDWQSELGHEHKTRRLTAGLGDALAALPPLSAGKKRRLFVATRAGWTAQFQSGIQGSDPFPVMSLFAGRLGVEAMRVCSTPDGEVFPATAWEVYAPPQRGGDGFGHRRSLHAGKDGRRWTFVNCGLPFPFESIECYTRSIMRDRFNRELLDRYLSEFNLSPFRDEFYLVSPRFPAVLLERPNWSKEPPEFTLQQVRDKEPWARH